MDVAVYSGNSSTQTISGLNFSPDLVWIKRRNGTSSHQLFDTVRGANKSLSSDSTTSESSPLTALTTFNNDGFTLGDAGGVNASGGNYVSWAWDAGASTASNTDGTITTNVRANTSTGFSVVSYTGNGTTGATIGHGLNAVPGLDRDWET